MHVDSSKCSCFYKRHRPVAAYGCHRVREPLIQSARTVSERFSVQSRYRKRRNTVCTRKGYAASVSRLTPATAALYFPFSIPKSGRTRSAHSRRRLIHTELQLKSLEKILIARRARSSYETCFVISFLINHKTGSAIRRCLPD